MQEKFDFRNALQEIIVKAQKNAGSITTESIEECLRGFELTQEQKEMIYNYLEAQKIRVEGAVLTGENPFARQEEEMTLTEEDQSFLEEYLAETEQADGTDDPRLPVYMKVCAQIGQEYAGRGIPLADIVQEGNVGLLMALGSLELREDTISEDEYIRGGIRGTIEAFLEEEAELKDSDDRMLEKINYIAEAIRNLSEELERKVSLEELSAYLEMPEEEVAEILKLTGEEIETEEPAEEKTDDTVGYAGINDFQVF